MVYSRILVHTVIWMKGSSGPVQKERDVAGRMGVYSILGVTGSFLSSDGLPKTCRYQLH